MRNFFAITRTVFLIAVISSPLAYPKERPELDETMKKLFNAFMNLEVMAVSSARFSDAENREVIKRDLDTVSAIKHSFPTKMKSEEPGLMAVLSLFKDYINDTQDQFSRGNTEYARHRVKTMGNFCMSCHSRTSGADFEDISERVKSLHLDEFEKAELYGATRQFDKAMASYWLLLQSPPKDEMGFVTYTRGLQNYVRLLVRVKQDPDTTLKALDSLSKKKKLPEFDRRMLAAWAKDAAFWTKDKLVVSDTTSEALVRKARTLIERAQSLHDFAADENGDISYLRASGYLHEVLDREAKSEKRGEALYLLGIAYESLQEPYLWDLNTVFYEECVREFPHSKQSEDCFHRYEKAIYFGFTGTGGTFVPANELKKLGQLRSLSTPK